MESGKTSENEVNSVQYIKNSYQDDANEFVYFLYKFKNTELVPGESWHHPKNHYLNIMALEDKTGDIDRVLLDLHPATWAYTALSSSFNQSHVSPSQSNYYPADCKNYGNSYQYWVEDGDRTYIVKPTMYGNDSSKTTYYHKHYYNYYKFDDYWVLQTSVNLHYNAGGGTNTSTDRPYRAGFGNQNNIKNLMLGKKIDYYIGTVKKVRV